MHPFRSAGVVGTARKEGNIELPLESPDLFRCLQAHRQSPRLLSVKSAPEVRVLPSAGITRHQLNSDLIAGSEGKYMSLAKSPTLMRIASNMRTIRASGFGVDSVIIAG